MALFSAETIVLSEKESIEFVNALIRPDSDYIARRNAIFDEADSRMTVLECEDGFVVDAPDFDFSTVRARNHNEVFVNFEIKVEEIYDALMQLANSVSNVYNKIVSREICSDASTWNDHGRTTKCELQVRRSIENVEEFCSNNNFDLAA